MNMWEPKMCRLALQLLGMLGNVLGMLCKVLGRPRHAYGSLVVHYSFGFTAYKAASGGEGILFDMVLLGPCRSMPRLAKNLAKHAEDVAKHVEIGRGRCQACLGVAKQAYTS